MPAANSFENRDASSLDVTSERHDDAHLIEAAEAEAAEAEALAAAARARVQAIRRRRQNEATDTRSAETAETPADDRAATPADEADELDCSATLVAEPTITDATELPDQGGKARWRQRKTYFRRPKRTTMVAAVGMLCTAALLAASAVMVRHHDQLLDKQQRAAEFTAAARQVVVTLMSISADSAKDDVQRIIDSSTGQFRDDFRGAAAEFVKAAQTAKVSTKTTVQAACLESMTEDTAAVAVAASSTLSNTAGAPEQPRSWRLSVKLARDGGKIKMSSMEFIP
ncbi:hypothetical protein [Mycobacterium scrofulaceum]|uniref:Mammalian cell entry protein n=1 Tax=Mycobacterium scrofulaceum TaxID=1783 RepID=A0A1X0KBP0_MYCSC|nr:hypothetical protein [Mycobacterium scrofulaceum]ORB72435.1 hypothetical protein BST44_19610 [Mycobacterium scrofulaceum]